MIIRPHRHGYLQQLRVLLQQCTNALGQALPQTQAYP